jgi:hypothetical protein
VQYPLDLLTKHTFKGNPTPVNVGLMLVNAAFNVALIIKIWRSAGRAAAV